MKTTGDHRPASCVYPERLPVPSRPLPHPQSPCRRKNPTRRKRRRKRRGRHVHSDDKTLRRTQHWPPPPARHIQHLHESGNRQECSAEAAAQLCLFLLLAWQRRARLAAHGPLSPSTSGLNRRSARPSPCRPSPRAVHSQTSHSWLPFTASALWEKQYRVAMKKWGVFEGTVGNETPKSGQCSSSTWFTLWGRIFHPDCHQHSMG